MKAALDRDSWNITVRHAQEVVELAVKGVLCYLIVTRERRGGDAHQDQRWLDSGGGRST